MHRTTPQIPTPTTTFDYINHSNIEHEYITNYINENSNNFIDYLKISAINMQNGYNNKSRI